MREGHRTGRRRRKIRFPFLGLVRIRVWWRVNNVEELLGCQGWLLTGYEMAMFPMSKTMEKDPTYAFIF